MRRTLCCVFIVICGAGWAQQPSGSARSFANRCTICHGGDGNGSDRAPAILSFVGSHSDAELATLVRTGRLDKGMPHFDFSDDEMNVLVAHLRGLASGTIAAAAGAGPGFRGPAPFQPHAVSWSNFASVRSVFRGTRPRRGPAGMYFDHGPSIVSNRATTFRSRE
jgi:cytochrome c553